MENLKNRYIGLKRIKGFGVGTIKTKRVWCSLLSVECENDFEWLVNSGVLRSKELNKMIRNNG